MVKPIIAANWKMNKTVRESVDFINELVRELSGSKITDEREVVVAPPFTAIYAASCAARGSAVRISAQNMYWEKEGAFTGEVSAPMLVESGCEYVILGHSERRHIFGETDEQINRKILKALEHKLKPIFCVGETLDERKAEQTFKVIERQLKGGLDRLSAEDMKRTVIAYEPVWAIGTGVTATPEQAEEVHQFIRKQIKSAEVPILYGGSVNPANIGSLMAQPNINGGLVGGASLKVDSFLKLIRF